MLLYPLKRLDRYLGLAVDAVAVEVNQQAERKKDCNRPFRLNIYEASLEASLEASFGARCRPWRSMG